MSATHSVPSTTKRFFGWSEVIVVLIQLLIMAAQMIRMVPCSAVSFVSMIPGKQIYILSIMHVCVCVRFQEILDMVCSRIQTNLLRNRVLAEPVFGKGRFGIHQSC